MHITQDRSDAPSLIALFRDSFTASEGAREGHAIGDLVASLLAGTGDDAAQVFCDSTPEGLRGAICLTRLWFQDDTRQVHLLSPVAVHPDWQSQGIGQALIRHAMKSLRTEGADCVFTYGDPAFYGKTGFVHIAMKDAPPPHPLSQPEGWLINQLAPYPAQPFSGPSRCAPALDDPALW